MVTTESLGATGAFPLIPCKYASLIMLQTCISVCNPVAQVRCTFGLPSVMVPVLSKTMCVIFEPFSSAKPPFFKRMPYFAAAPVAVITAVGVASPRAQGHATRSVVRPYCMTYKAFSKMGHWVPGAISAMVTTSKTNTMRYHTKAVATERTITDGMNQAAMLSATV